MNVDARRYRFPQDPAKQDNVLRLGLGHCNTSNGLRLTLVKQLLSFPVLSNMIISELGGIRNASFPAWSSTVILLH